MEVKDHLRWRNWNGWSVMRPVRRRQTIADCDSGGAGFHGAGGGDVRGTFPPDLSALGPPLQRGRVSRLERSARSASCSRSHGRARGADAAASGSRSSP